MEKTKDEFVFLIKEAVKDHGSASYKELHEFLVATFNKGAVGGQLSLDAMDNMVTESAALPRKLGFAPKNEDIYATDADRKAARAELFNEITSTGHITLDQWLKWAIDHITAKAAAL